MVTRIQAPARRAFTIIELLVVIGVIAVIAGIAVAAFNSRNPGVSVRSGQLVSVSLLNAARARAVATGYPARLLIAADDVNAPDDYLRKFYVAYQEVRATNSTTGAVTLAWRLTDAGTALDQGVYVIPPGLTAAQLDSSVNLTDYTSNKLESVFSSVTLFNNNFGTDIKTQRFYYYEIDPQGGGLSPTILYRLVLSTGQLTLPGSTPPGPRFDNPNFVSGFRLSTYGVPTLVNDVPSFQ